MLMRCAVDGESDSHAFRSRACCCLQRYYWAGLRDHVHLRPDIVANASALVAAVATAAGGAYNAVHYRSVRKTPTAKQ